MEEGLFRPYASEITAPVSSSQDFLPGSGGKKKLGKRGKSSGMHKLSSSSSCVTGCNMKHRAMVIKK